MHRHHFGDPTSCRQIRSSPPCNGSSETEKGVPRLKKTSSMARSTCQKNLELKQNLTENFWDKVPSYIGSWSSTSKTQRTSISRSSRRRTKTQDTRHCTDPPAYGAVPNINHEGVSTSTADNIRNPSRHSPLTRCSSLKGGPRKLPRYTQLQLGSSPLSSPRIQITVKGLVVEAVSTEDMVKASQSPLQVSDAVVVPCFPSNRHCAHRTQTTSEQFHNQIRTLVEVFFSAPALRICNMSTSLSLCHIGHRNGL